MNVVNSFNDFDKLEEIIVGTGFPTELPANELSFKLFYHDNIFNRPYFSVLNQASGQLITIKKRWVEELNEDIDEFVTTLQSLGVVVRRPEPLNALEQFATPNWKSYTTSALNVRDQTLIVGDTIVETPPIVRFRYFENDLLKKLFYNYFKQGAKWVVMPRPLMLDKSFDLSYVGEHKEYTKHIKDHPLDYGHELMIDAAQCVRLGKHILVNCANENHRLGAKWLQRQFPEYTIIARYFSVDNHMDSTVIPLRPGLLLVDENYFKPELYPELDSWDKVVAPTPSRKSIYDNADMLLASTRIDINVLSVNRNLVICHNEFYPDLQPILKPYGIECVPVRFRHGRIFMGAFHCITLDVRRDGVLEDYLE